MFRPNLTCKISVMGDTDVYGKRLYGDWTTAKFAIVKLEQTSQRTSVRTDASGSRAFATEIVADARLLFLPNVVLKPGDKVKFSTFTLTVDSVFPRHRVDGTFDHWQVDCSVYGGG